MSSAADGPLCAVCRMDRGVEEYEYLRESRYDDEPRESTAHLCEKCAKVSGIEHISRPISSPNEWDTTQIMLIRVLHEVEGGPLHRMHQLRPDPDRRSALERMREDDRDIRGDR